MPFSLLIINEFSHKKNKQENEIQETNEFMEMVSPYKLIKLQINKQQEQLMSLVQQTRVCKPLI